MGKGPWVEGKRVPELGLSWPCRIVEHRTLFRSAEHYYQYHRCLKEEDRERILAAQTGEEAARLGEECEPQPDWDEYKSLVMGRAIELKYHHEPDIAELLEATPVFRFQEADEGEEQTEMDKMIQEHTEWRRFEQSDRNGFLEKRAYYWASPYALRQHWKKVGCWERAPRVFEYDDDF
jgi:hypothetical protein